MTLKRPFFKTTCFILLISLIVQEFAWAAPELPTVVSLPQNPNLLEIPADFCSLKAIHRGNNGKLIIHIEDAHSNLSGQENLAKTIDAIAKKYGVSPVLVEGGAIDGSLTPLKKITSAKVTQRAAKGLLVEGEIAGEEYLSLISKQPMKIIGIEDMGLYLKNVQDYARLADKREAILNYLNSIQRGVDTLKSKLYPKELLEYEKKLRLSSPKSFIGDQPDSRFRGNDVTSLLSLAPQDDVLKNFPNVQRLKTLQAKENTIDFNLANLEQAALSEEIAKRKNIDLSRYPNLILYRDYLKAFSDLNIPALLDETERLEDEVCKRVLLTTDPLLTRSIDRYLGLLKKAYSIQMSSKDFDFFKANEPDFATVDTLAFINRKLMDLGYFESLLPYQDVLEEGKKALEAFYESVDERDLAFVRNTERLLDSGKRIADSGKENTNSSISALRSPLSALHQNGVAILITGGYHTQHLEKLFTDKGYSFVTLTPLVTSETNQANYEKRLLQPLAGNGPLHSSNHPHLTSPLIKGEEWRGSVGEAGGGKSEKVRCMQAAYRGIVDTFALKAGVRLSDPKVLEARRYFDQILKADHKSIIQNLSSATPQVLLAAARLAAFDRAKTGGSVAMRKPLGPVTLVALCLGLQSLVAFGFFGLGAFPHLGGDWLFLGGAFFSGGTTLIVLQGIARATHQVLLRFFKKIPYTENNIAKRLTASWHAHRPSLAIFFWGLVMIPLMLIYQTVSNRVHYFSYKLGSIQKEKEFNKAFWPEEPPLDTNPERIAKEMIQEMAILRNPALTPENALRHLRKLTHLWPFGDFDGFRKAQRLIEPQILEFLDDGTLLARQPLYVQAELVQVRQWILAKLDFNPRYQTDQVELLKRLAMSQTPPLEALFFHSHYFSEEAIKKLWEGEHYYLQKLAFLKLKERAKDVQQELSSISEPSAPADMESGVSFKVIKAFQNRYGYPDQVERDIQTIRDSEQSLVHKIELNEVDRIRIIRGLPTRLRDIVQKASVQYRIPARVLVAYLIVMARKSSNLDGYTVNQAIEILRKRGSKNLSLFLNLMIPEPLGRARPGRQWSDFFGGVVADGKASMGVGQIRPVQVRKFWAWRDNGDNSILDRSDREISWRLLDDEKNIGAMAALWRGVVDRVSTYRRQAQKGIEPDLSDAGQEAAKEGLGLSLASKVPNRLAYFASLPDPRQFGSEDWLSVLYDSLYHDKLEAPLEYQKLVICSGVLDDKPAEFVGIDEVEDVLTLSRYLEDPDPYLQEAARRTLRGLSKDKNLAIRQKAAEILETVGGARLAGFDPVAAQIALPNDPYLAQVHRWLADKKGLTNVTADDGTIFEFQYFNEGEDERFGGDRQRLTVFQGGKEIGYAHFRNGCDIAWDPSAKTTAVMYISFNDEEFHSHPYRPDDLDGFLARNVNNDAVYVDKDFRDHYTGIGRSLMGFALRIAQQSGMTSFRAVEVKNEKFFRDLNFRVLQSEDKKDKGAERRNKNYVFLYPGQLPAIEIYKRPHNLLLTNPDTPPASEVARLSKDSSEPQESFLGRFWYLPRSLMIVLPFSFGIYKFILPKLIPLISALIHGDFSRQVVTNVFMASVCFVLSVLVVAHEFLKGIGFGDIAHSITWPLLTFATLRWTLFLTLPRVIGLNPNDAVLEIGAGPITPFFMSGKAKSYIASDIAEGVVQINTFLSRWIKRPGHTNQIVNAEEMEFEGHTFDKVLAVNPIYLNQIAAAEVSRVLKKGGSFFVVFDKSFGATSQVELIERAGFERVSSKKVWCLSPFILLLKPFGMVFEFKMKDQSLTAARLAGPQTRPGGAKEAVLNGGSRPVVYSSERIKKIYRGLKEFWNEDRKNFIKFFRDLQSHGESKYMSNESIELARAHGLLNHHRGNKLPRSVGAIILGMVDYENGFVKGILKPNLPSRKAQVIEEAVKLRDGQPVGLKKKKWYLLSFPLGKNGGLQPVARLSFQRLRKFLIKLGGKVERIGEEIRVRFIHFPQGSVLEPETKPSLGREKSPLSLLTRPSLRSEPGPEEFTFEGIQKLAGSDVLIKVWNFETQKDEEHAGFLKKVEKKMEFVLGRGLQLMLWVTFGNSQGRWNRYRFILADKDTRNLDAGSLGAYGYSSFRLLRSVKPVTQAAVAPASIRKPAAGGRLTKQNTKGNRNLLKDNGRLRFYEPIYDSEPRVGFFDTLGDEESRRLGIRNARHRMKKRPVRRGTGWVRISASKKTAVKFYRDWKNSDRGAVELFFNGQRYLFSRDALTKASTWFRSNWEFERQGRFIAKKTPNAIEVEDFIPQASVAVDAASTISGAEDANTEQGCKEIDELFSKELRAHFHLDDPRYDEMMAESKDRPSIFLIEAHSHPFWSNYPDGPSINDPKAVPANNVEVVYGMLKNKFTIFNFEGKSECLPAARLTAEGRPDAGIVEAVSQEEIDELFSPRWQKELNIRRWMVYSAPIFIALALAHLFFNVDSAKFYPLIGGYGLFQYVRDNSLVLLGLFGIGLFSLFYWEQSHLIKKEREFGDLVNGLKETYKFNPIEAQISFFLLDQLEALSRSSFVQWHPSLLRRVSIAQRLAGQMMRPVPAPAPAQALEPPKSSIAQLADVVLGLPDTTRDSLLNLPEGGLLTELRRLAEENSMLAKALTPFNGFGNKQGNTLFELAFRAELERRSSTIAGSPVVQSPRSVSPATKPAGPWPSSESSEARLAEELPDDAVSKWHSLQKPSIKANLGQPSAARLSTQSNPLEVPHHRLFESGGNLDVIGYLSALQEDMTQHPADRYVLRTKAPPLDKLKDWLEFGFSSSLSIASLKKSLSDHKADIQRISYTPHEEEKRTLITITFRKELDLGDGPLQSLSLIVPLPLDSIEAQKKKMTPLPNLYKGIQTLFYEVSKGTFELQILSNLTLNTTQAFQTFKDKDLFSQEEYERILSEEVYNSLLSAHKAKDRQEAQAREIQERTEAARKRLIKVLEDKEADLTRELADLGVGPASTLPDIAELRTDILTSTGLIASEGRITDQIARLKPKTTTPKEQTRLIPPGFQGHLFTLEGEDLDRVLREFDKDVVRQCHTLLSFMSGLGDEYASSPAPGEPSVRVVVHNTAEDIASSIAGVVSGYNLPQTGLQPLLERAQLILPSFSTALTDKQLATPSKPDVEKFILELQENLFEPAGYLFDHTRFWLKRPMIIGRIDPQFWRRAGVFLKQPIWIASMIRDHEALRKDSDSKNVFYGHWREFSYLCLETIKEHYSKMYRKIYSIDLSEDFEKNNSELSKLVKRIKALRSQSDLIADVNSYVRLFGEECYWQHAIELSKTQILGDRIINLGADKIMPEVFYQKRDRTRAEAILFCTRPESPLYSHLLPANRTDLDSEAVISIIAYRETLAGIIARMEKVIGEAQTQSNPGEKTRLENLAGFIFLGGAVEMIVVGKAVIYKNDLEVSPEAALEHLKKIYAADFFTDAEVEAKIARLEEEKKLEVASKPNEIQLPPDLLGHDFALHGRALDRALMDLDKRVAEAVSFSKCPQFFLREWFKEAKKILPSFTTDCSEAQMSRDAQMDSDDRIGLSQFLEDLRHRLFAPAGYVWDPGSAVSKHSFIVEKIDPASWKQAVTFLGQPIWIAWTLNKHVDMHLVSDASPYIFQTGQFSGVRDYGKLASVAQIKYHMIINTNGVREKITANLELAEFAWKSICEIAELAHTWVKKAGIQNEEDFIDWKCDLSRFTAIEGTKCWVVQRLIKRFQASHRPDSAPSLEDFLAGMHYWARPGGIFKERVRKHQSGGAALDIIKGYRFEYEEARSAMSFLKIFKSTMASMQDYLTRSQVPSISSEDSDQLKARAIVAFLNFLTEVLSSEKNYKDYLQYKNYTKYLEPRLKELVPNFDSEELWLRSMLAQEDPAEKALKLLQEIYSKDFLTDEEIEQKIVSLRAGKTGARLAQSSQEIADQISELLGEMGDDLPAELKLPISNLRRFLRQVRGGQSLSTFQIKFLEPQIEKVRKYVEENIRSKKRLADARELLAIAERANDIDEEQVLLLPEEEQGRWRARRERFAEIEKAQEEVLGLLTGGSFAQANDPSAAEELTEFADKKPGAIIDGWDTERERVEKLSVRVGTKKPPAAKETKPSSTPVASGFAPAPDVWPSEAASLVGESPVVINFPPVDGEGKQRLLSDRSVHFTVSYSAKPKREPTIIILHDNLKETGDQDWLSLDKRKLRLTSSFQDSRGYHFRYSVELPRNIERYKIGVVVGQDFKWRQMVSVTNGKSGTRLSETRKIVPAPKIENVSVSFPVVTDGSQSIDSDGCVYFEIQLDGPVQTAGNFIVFVDGYDVHHMKAREVSAQILNNDKKGKVVLKAILPKSFAEYKIRISLDGGQTWNAPELAVKVTHLEVDPLFKSPEPEAVVPAPAGRGDSVKKDASLRRTVEEEINRMMESMGPELFVELARRYHLELINFVWAVVGSKLEGSYDKEKIQQAISQRMLDMAMLSGTPAQAGPLLREGAGLEAQGPQPTIEVLKPGPITQEEIAQVAAKLDEAIEKAEKEKTVNEGLAAMARAQARSILKKLEESYFFRTFQTFESPAGAKGERALAAIESIRTNTKGLLLKGVVEELLEDVKEALRLQETLWNSGIRRGTTLNLYQLFGVMRMLKQKKILLADEMGLGKTLETLSTFFASGKRQALVAGPSMALKRWAEDLANHTDADLEVVVLSIEGGQELSKILARNPKIRTTTFSGTNGDLSARNGYLFNLPPVEAKDPRRIVLVNYELIPNLEKHRLKEGLTPPRIDFLALDEVQQIKRPRTITSSAIFGTEKDERAIEAEYKVLVSGTPLENRLSDLFIFLRFLTTEDTSEQGRLLSRLTLQNLSLLFRTTDLARISVLHSYLTNMMVRRLKDDVLTGLPVKVMKIAKLDPFLGAMRLEEIRTGGGVSCDPLVQLAGSFTAQTLLYELAVSDPRKFIDRYVKGLPGLQEDYDEELSEEEFRNVQVQRFLRREQVATDPSIFDSSASGIKFEAAKHLIRERIKQGKSVLIFTDYKTVAKNFRTMLEEEFGSSCVAYVDGGTDKKTARPAEFDRFQSRNAQILIATTGTSSLSIDLTQADSIIFLNYPWKPSAKNQAIDRAHRIDPDRNKPGKELEVIMLELDVPESIDRFKAEVIRKKAILAEMLVNGNLTAEILDAFMEVDRLVRGLQTHRVRVTAVSPDSYELTLFEQFRLKVGQIITEKDPGKIAGLWDEIAELYNKILEHKASFFANMASLDVLSGEAFPELKRAEGRDKVSVLDLASGPSTLLRAYERNRQKFESRSFRLDIRDYDISRAMLALGVRREGGQVLGSFDQLDQMAPESFDVINLSHAFFHAENPVGLFQNIRRILKPNGLFILILPSKQKLSGEFLEGLKSLGLEPRTGLSDELRSVIEPHIYEQLLEEYGEEFVRDLERQAQQNFTYLIAVKSKSAGEALPASEDFRLSAEYRVRDMQAAKIARLQQRNGRFILVPDNVVVEGEMMRMSPSVANGEEDGAMPGHARRSELDRISRLFTNLEILISSYQETPKKKGEIKSEKRLDNITRHIDRKFSNVRKWVEKCAGNLSVDERKKLVGIMTTFQDEKLVQQWLKADENNPYRELLTHLKDLIRVSSAARLATGGEAEKLINDLIEAALARKAPALVGEGYFPGFVKIKDTRFEEDPVDSAKGKLAEGLRYAESATDDPAKRELIASYLKALMDHPRAGELSVLQFDGLIRHLVAWLSGNANIGKQQKESLDGLMKKFYEDVRRKVDDPDSAAALKKAMLYSALANMLDPTHFGAFQAFAKQEMGEVELSLSDEGGVSAALENAIRYFVKKGAAIDEFDKFIREIQSKPGKTILYFLDNHGEVILDQIVIEQLLNNGYKVAAVGRAKAVQNDVSYFEAREIFSANPHLSGYLGSGQLKVVTDGSEYLGADLTRSTDHPEFLNAWQGAVAYIAKGSGNFHGLFDHRLTVPGLHIFMSKRVASVIKKINSVKGLALPYALNEPLFIYQERFGARLARQRSKGSSKAVTPSAGSEREMAVAAYSMAQKLRSLALKNLPKMTREQFKADLRKNLAVIIDHGMSWRKNRRRNLALKRYLSKKYRLSPQQVLVVKEIGLAFTAISEYQAKHPSDSDHKAGPPKGILIIHNNWGHSRLTNRSLFNWMRSRLDAEFLLTNSPPVVLNAKESDRIWDPVREANFKKKLDDYFHTPRIGEARPAPPAVTKLLSPQQEFIFKRRARILSLLAVNREEGKPPVTAKQMRDASIESCFSIRSSTIDGDLRILRNTPFLTVSRGKVVLRYSTKPRIGQGPGITTREMVLDQYQLSDGTLKDLERRIGKKFKVSLKNIESLDKIFYEMLKESPAAALAYQTRPSPRVTREPNRKTGGRLDAPFRIQDFYGVGGRLPGVAIRKVSEMDRGLRTSLPLFAGAPLISPEGVLFPVAVLSAGAGQPAYAGIQIVGRNRGTVVIGLKGAEASGSRFSTLRITPSSIKAARARRSMETQGADLQIQNALDSRDEKDSLTRKLLEWVVARLTRSEHVAYFISFKDQDQSEMLRQLRALERELDKINRDSEFKLNIYPRFVDEKGNEISVQGFVSKALPGNETVRAVYSGILSAALLAKAVEMKASYVPLEPAYTEAGKVHVIPYKAASRLAIVAPLNEEIAAQMLQALLGPGVDVTQAKTRMVSAPYAVPGISVQSYREEGLIVRAIAWLKQELYQAYLTLQTSIFA